MAQAAHPSIFTIVDAMCLAADCANRKHKALANGERYLCILRNIANKEFWLFMA